MQISVQATDADFFMFKGEDRTSANLLEPKTEENGVIHYEANLGETLILVTENKPRKRSAEVQISAQMVGV